MAQTAPYGAWRSPISAEMVAAGSVSLSQLVLDGDDVYWIEGRSTEGGRNVIVRRTPDAQTADVNPAPYNARTRAHEYGGGAYTADRGTVYFTNYADQRIYRVRPGEEPEPLTAAGPWRYADLMVDPRRGLLFCVIEDHSRDDRDVPREREGDGVVNGIACVPLAGGRPRILAAPADFSSTPRLSPDGLKLSWLCWDHPNMPWDGGELRTAQVLAHGTLQASMRVAGEPGGAESIVQPEWGPDGALYFVSDRTGWWSIYRGEHGEATRLCSIEAELAGPQWVFGLRWYGFLEPGPTTADTQIAAAFCQKGSWSLGIVDCGRRTLDRIDLPYTSISNVQTRGRTVYFIGASPTEQPAVIALDVDTRQSQVLHRSSVTPIDPAYVSEPQTIEFPTSGGKTAFGFFYPPRNPDFAGREGELPPLLVMSHGGPTGATQPVLRASTQYWTSRGIAVLDVNYGGSTGYGREYRDRLKDNWGIVDLDDCANGARYLVEQGLVDGKRLAITGGSAGGFTTLASLTFKDVFAAGASYYGISDLEKLAVETHKFESRYLDRLIGPYPERRDIYLERSPIYHTDQLSSPMIILQGLEDKVVPPNQAESMVEALRQKKLPVAYLIFEGEQHGFRRQETIRRALEAELYFYSRIFAFEPADDIEPVTIENFR
jgi:dipeptidyl aminopeptidase/acylaminoacyl peptidase